MRKILLLAAVALTAAVLVPAQANARHTTAHRLSALETKVTGLQKKVNTLSSFANNCLAFDWAPIGWYGNESPSTGQPFGYVFDNDGADPPGTQAPFYTSGLDIALSGGATFYVAAVNPSCLSKIARQATALKAELGVLGKTRRSARAL